MPFTFKKDLVPSPDAPQRFRDFILQPDPDSLRAVWPLKKKLPLLLTKWTRGEAAVKEVLRREFYPCFMTFTTGRSAGSWVPVLQNTGTRDREHGHP